MKKIPVVVISAVLALGCAISCLLCLERVGVGKVGVVYTANGVEDKTLPAGWHWLSPLKSVKQFPISQQQIVFSNDPGDYNAKEHDDWSIDAPADGGMVKMNLTVNYAFDGNRVVDLYKRFNGMDGEALVSSYIQNSIIAYVKEVTPQFSVMDIYSDRKSDVNQAITAYLAERLGEEYGINVISALVIDVQLDEGLQEKIKAKEQAKQDAEIAELEKQTAAAEAEVEKTKAQAAADVKVIEAQAEAESNRIIAQSITPELIQMTEAQARLQHGWVTVTGADSVVVDDAG